MKVAALLLAFCLYGHAEGISTKMLNPSMPVFLEVSQEEDTVLHFPDRVTKIFGVGLASQGSTKGATIAAKLSEDGKWLVLRALTNKKERMTVVIGNNAYVFTLNVGEHPDMVKHSRPGMSPWYQRIRLNKARKLTKRPSRTHDLITARRTWKG
jgi:hypothetical protein